MVYCCQKDFLLPGSIIPHCKSFVIHWFDSIIQFFLIVFKCSLGNSIITIKYVITLRNMCNMHTLYSLIPSETPCQIEVMKKHAPPKSIWLSEVHIKDGIDFVYSSVSEASASMGANTASIAAFRGNRAPAHRLDKPSAMCYNESEKIYSDKGA